MTTKKLRALRLFLPLIVALATVIPSPGQGYNSFQKITFIAPGVGQRIFQNGASSFHTLEWVVSAGTLSSCSIEIDTSADGVSWALGGLIAPADCHLTGNVNGTGVANYLRVNLLTLAGGATLTVTYKGYAQGLKNPTFSFDLPSPSVADSGQYQHKLSGNNTFARLSCSVDQGTASINLDVRQEANPNSTSGNPALASSLVCTTNTGSTTVFARPAYIANSPLALLITATSGSPSVLRVHVEMVPQ